MRVLVIGGTLFIGRALVEALRARGARVAVLNRGRTEDDLPADVERIVGDREQLPESRAAIEAFAPSVVLHNVVSNEGHVRSWLDACAGIEARMVMTSSSDVYAVYGRSHGTEEGPVDHDLQDEDAPLRSVLHPYRSMAKDQDDPRWHYDKIPAERLLLSSRPDACTLRLPMVLGPRDPQHRLRALLDAMDRGRPHIVHEAGFADWHSIYGDVDNVADAMAAVCCADTLPQQVYNVGDAVLSMRDIVLHVAAYAKWSGTYITPSRDELSEPLAQPWHVEHWLAIDCGRIRADLDWSPTLPLDETFRRTLDWERAVRDGEGTADPEREAAEDAFVAARVSSEADGED